MQLLVILMTMNTVTDNLSITVSEMRSLEEKAFARGVTVLELMERAGKECASIIETKQGTGNRTLIFCGPGNNGGDGFVCARYLAAKNEVFVVMPVELKTDTSKTNCKLALDSGIKFIGMGEAVTVRADIIIDALLGIGAKGALHGSLKEACKIINSLDSFIVSIDVPTGMDAETGECNLDAVKPNATICIHAPKTGEIKAGKNKTGELWIADIGL